jgi:hypothetical protein
MTPLALNTKTLQIGLPSWIIQDGNYRDFSVGQEATFALEFSPHSLTPAEGETPRADLLAPGRYSIQGRVEFITKEAWILDFGLQAYQDLRDLAPPRDASLGSWVKGEVDLGVDPYPYFEQLSRLKGMPELTYRWLLRGIMLETTPWLTGPDNSRFRDPAKQSFRSVDKTDA